MVISINAKVSCSDGPCGQTTHVILKPTPQEITHLVIRTEAFPETEILVSIDQVAEGTPNQIRLKCSRGELLKMQTFAKVEFVSPNLMGFSGGPYMARPFYAPVSAYVPFEKGNIPAGELAIRLGAMVEAVDGRVGRLGEFLINPSNHHVTDLVISEGHLNRQKDVTVPVSQIDCYKEMTIILKLNKTAIKSHPTVPVQRGRSKRNVNNR